MNIDKLTLHSAQLPAQERFYGDALGLPTNHSTSGLTVKIGPGILEFLQSEGFAGRYHFAFNIPRNGFALAEDWLKARVELIADASGRTRFHTDEWNADNLYFYDPQGNIVELIARHELENDSSDSFSAASLLEISEIGLAAPNASKLVQWFADVLRVRTYKSFSDSFAPIGDAHGLVIAVQQNRIWFPDTGIPAEILPVQITLYSDHQQTFELPGLPYQIHLEPHLISHGKDAS
jgi:catechol-2,3-dioxygenase